MGKMEGIALALLTAVMWGFLPILMKAALLAFSGSFITSVRFLGALMILFAYVRLRRGHLPLRPFPRVAILGGAGLSANYLFFIYGLDRTTAISAEIIIQMAIILTVLIGVLVFREMMNAAKAIGTVLSIMGVWMIIWNGVDFSELLSNSSFLGNVMIVVSAVSWTAYAYSQVILNRTFPSSHALGLILLPATFIALATFPTFEISSIGPVDVSVLAILVVFAIIPYASLAKSFKSVESSTAIIITTLAALVTPIGVFLFRLFGAPFVRGENITIFTISGGILIFFGIFLTVKGRSS